MKNISFSSGIQVNSVQSFEFFKLLVCSAYLFKLRKFKIVSSEVEVLPLVRLMKITKVSFVYSALSILGIYIHYSQTKLVS